LGNFEINKIIMALLLALLISVIAGIVANHLVEPEKLAKNAYEIEGVEESGSVTAVSGPDVAEPITPLLAKASVENGQKVAQKCLQCHTFEKGGQNKIGPNLWGVVGAKHGHVDGFAYSSALTQNPGTWDYESLNHFLYKPREYIKGTKMSFVGLKKTQDRADLIAYLRTLNDSPLPLPAN
jgi:cytochrome c